MTKKMLRRIAALVLSVIIVAGTMLTAFAESSQVPYDNYTYWEDISGSGRKLVYNRAMYEVAKLVKASDIGVPAYTELTDVCTDKDGNIFLLDKGSETSPSRIIMLDSDYKLVKEITTVYKTVPTDGGDETDTEELTFSGVRNIYVHTDGSIFICDYDGRRVIKADLDGNFIDEYTLPDSPLIPDNFDFRPIKVVADSRGYVYILSEGSYYGALLYAPAESGTAKEFIGFYGANTVTNSILGAIQSLLNRMFPNNERKSVSQRQLPYTFSDIVIDSHDFIYTATDQANRGHLKKLNPGAGNNILDSDTVSFIDTAINRTYDDNGYAFTQKITGLEVDDNEFMYALDSQYGRIFVYDSECRMLTAFGGGMLLGTQNGTFGNASALALHGDGNVLVVDKANGTLTTFKPTDYGKKVLTLTKMTIDGDYIESREGWEEVMKLDHNLQIAYTGLARAYLAEDNYKDAMDVALEGYDRDTYALAYEYYRTELISDNFIWIFTVIVLLIAAIVAVVIVRKKRPAVDEVSNKGGEVRFAFRTLIHPGLCFEEMKEKHRGSLRVSVVFLILFYVTAVVQVLWGGFLFTNYDPGEFNSLWVFVQSAGLVALWVVSNWLVTTLLGGKGKLKEIFIVTCYSLFPIVVERVIYIVLTNFLLPSEASFLGILSTVAYIYTGILLIIGMMNIHEFSMTRFLGTTLLTVCIMAAIVFLAILIGMLLQQLGGFLSTVVIELIM